MNCSWGDCKNGATVEHTHVQHGEVLWSTRPFCAECAASDRHFIESINRNESTPIEVFARPLDPELAVIGEAIGLAFERLAVPS